MTCNRVNPLHQPAWLQVEVGCLHDYKSGRNLGHWPWYTAPANATVDSMQELRTVVAVSLCTPCRDAWNSGYEMRGRTRGSYINLHCKRRPGRRFKVAHTPLH